MKGGKKDPEGPLGFLWPGRTLGKGATLLPKLVLQDSHSLYIQNQGLFILTFCAHTHNPKKFFLFSFVPFWPIGSKPSRGVWIEFLLQKFLYSFTSINLNLLLACVYKNEVTTHYSCYQGIDQ